MRILMLSWEYPPRVVGGLAQHVAELSRALAEAGNTVEVVTAAADGLPAVESVEEVTVHRVLPYHGTPLGFVSWVNQLNLAMLEKGVALFHRKKFDLVHAHDWLTAYAGRGIKHIFHVPLFGTIHATEYGRNSGLHTPEQRYIGEVEWSLGFEAWKIICCSNFMRDEVMKVLHLPADKVHVINNGIRPEAFRVAAPDPAVRRRFAAPEEKLLFFIGRLVPEKGVQVLLQALPLLRERFPGIRLVVAGRGPYEEELRRQAAGLGLTEAVHFPGYVDDETRNQLYAQADAAVFPSLYEPFGLVALEGMAAGTPVVVAGSGGLAEIVTHDVNGLQAYPGDAHSLAAQIGRLLEDAGLARRLSRRATADISERYSWEAVARRTEELYQKVVFSKEARLWRRRLEQPEAGAAAEGEREAPPVFHAGAVPSRYEGGAEGYPVGAAQSD